MRLKPFWILLLLLAIFHFATMQIYPPPFVDEGWLGSRAWSFRSTHLAFGPLDRGVFEHFAGYWTYFPLLPCFLQSLMFVGSTEPTLARVRILSVLFGLLLLVALYSIFRKLAGAKAALLGVFMISFSPVFLYSAHLARYDIIVAAFGFSAVALSMNAERGSYWRHFGAGILSAAAFEVHPYGCFYAPICVLIYFLNDGWRAWKSRNLWMFIAGTAGGLTGYFLLHVARYPSTWMAINKIAGSHTHTPPLLSGSLVEMYRSLEGFLRLAFFLSPFLISAFVLTLIYLVFNREQKDRPLLFLLLAFAIVPSLILKNQFGYYAIFYVPMLEFSGIYLLFRARHRILRLLLVLAMVGSLVYGFTSLRNSQMATYRLVQSRLASEIKPGEVVMGNQIWWFGLYEHPWYSWEELFYFRQFKGGTSLEDALKELRPQILIIDAHLSYFIRDYPKGDESYFAQLSLPATELKSILAKYATVRAEFDAGYYGRIQIIEFHWNH